MHVEIEGTTKKIEQRAKVIERKGKKETQTQRRKTKRTQQPLFRN